MNLKLKCLHMGFAELKSLKELTNDVYTSLIEEAHTVDEAKGFKSELNSFNVEINEVIQGRVIDFITV